MKDKSAILIRCEAKHMKSMLRMAVLRDVITAAPKHPHNLLMAPAPKAPKAAEKFPYKHSPFDIKAFLLRKGKIQQCRNEHETSCCFIWCTKLFSQNNFLKQIRFFFQLICRCMVIMDRDENLQNPTFFYVPLISKKYAVYNCRIKHENQGLKMEHV